MKKITQNFYEQGIKYIMKAKKLDLAREVLMYRLALHLVPSIKELQSINKQFKTLHKDNEVK